MSKNKTPKENILVLGIGNILLQDEGIGVHAIQEMERMEWPEYIHLLDGGTGGFHILSLLQEYNTIIMIDASLDKSPIGNVNLIEPKFSKDFPKALSSHDIGLKDLIDSAILLDSLPKIYLITITISPDQDIGMELSSKIQNSIPQIISQVKQILSL
ncbi:MAG: hydrogenase maturation protease [Bacteroidales bacterium]|nr:hydrogenase maturation protease [Bacteroidales bacterium]